MDKLGKGGLDYIAILRGIIRRHKLLMGAVFLVLAIPLLVLVYSKSRPQFESTATIAVEPSPFDQIPIFRDMPRQGNIGTPLMLLKSRSVSEAVIEALPKESFDELLANTQHTDYSLEITNWIKKKLGRPLTVLSPQQRAAAEIQNARMQFLPAPGPGGILNIKSTASRPRVAMDLVNTHIQVLLSRTRGANQEEARKVREFLEQQLQQAKQSLTETEDNLAKFQKQKGRITLAGQTERDLAKLSELESTLAEAQSGREVLANRITGMRQALDKGKGKETKGPTENQDKDKNETPGADTQARLNTFKVAQERLAKLEAKLLTLRERYTEAHPLVQVTQQEVTSERARIAQLARDLPSVPVPGDTGGSRATPMTPPDRTEDQRQLLAMLEAEDETLKGTIATLKTQVDRMRKSLQNLSQDEMVFSNLRRTVEAHRNLFTVLSDKLMGARIREQGETGTIRIIDPASFPLQPTQSHPQKRALMVLALAAGIAFGMAFGIEFWRQPVETESDIKNLTNLGVLGSVGVIGTPAARWKKHLKTKRSPLPIHLPDALVPTAVPMELYRAIRATLETERLKGAFRSILVTSPGPSEGKSTTILNLAHVLQEFGRRVLVVEADLRQPVLHRLLNLPVTPSLVDFLRGAATLQDVCHALPSGVTVIPGQIAREDVGTLLAPARARELLKAAKTHYDTVLIDSAPLLAVPDDLLLLPVIDRVILVVKASVTSKRDLRRATAVLEYANARTLGVILNQAHPHDVHYYRRRYRKYYPMVDGQPTVVAPRGFRPLSWIRDKLPFGRSSGSSGVEVPSQQEAGSEQPAAGSTERRET